MSAAITVKPTWQGWCKKHGQVDTLPDPGAKDPNNVNTRLCIQCWNEDGIPRRTTAILPSRDEIVAKLTEIHAAIEFLMDDPRLFGDHENVERTWEALLGARNDIDRAREWWPSDHDPYPAIDRMHNTAPSSEEGSP